MDSPNPNELTKLEKQLLRDKKRSDDADVIYTSFFETEKSIIEQICSPIDMDSATLANDATYATDTSFIVYDKVTASVDYLSELPYKGKVYRPIVDESLLRGAVFLPSGIEEYGSDADLLKEISEFLNANFEVPAKFQGFLPYIVLFSWVAQKFPFIPYLHFVGLTSTGKTTAAEALSSVCYKTCDASGSITLSSMFRMANAWQGTLFLDEFEPDSENYKEMIAFLKAGVSNRVILRVEGDKKREVKAYVIKSMKIFTSEQPIISAGLRSRMYVIEMQKTARKIPLIKQRKFYKQAQSLRNKLLLWRLRHYPIIDLTKIEYGYEELSSFDRRVQQVLTPIYYLSDEASRTEIIKFAKTQEEETKRERRESIDGEIFQAINDFLPTDPTVKQITERLNADRGRKPITEKRVANIIRHILLFDIQRMGHENTSTILISEKPSRLEDLHDYYNSTPLSGVESVASVASVAGASDGAKNATRPQKNDATRSNEFPLLDENGVPIEEETGN